MIDNKKITNDDISKSGAKNICKKNIATKSGVTKNSSKSYGVKRHYIGIKIWLAVSVFLVILSLLYIFGFIGFNGFKEMSYEFITQKPKGSPLGSEGGIYPAIIGSICFMLIAIVLASLSSFAVAIDLSFYTKSASKKRVVSMIVSTMAGIPSIVLGLFGYSFLVVALKFGVSVFTGGIVLGIMIFPYMTVKFEKCFSEIDGDILEASYALGTNKFYTIIHLVLPICYREMISTMSLAGCFAMGATAPILFTGGVLYASRIKDIFSPAMALPLHLYMLIGEGISLEKAYGTSFVLVLVLISFNAIALLFSWKKE
ncbi:MAG: ABC transporter permease subunit [Tissierellales bacterium]|nr:ABC transporter permease subunit [Tissierellales bacterium]